MRILVCEFVTGGGLRDKPLPNSLLREGMMMRDALVADLLALGGMSIATTHDDRLPAPAGADSVPVGSEDAAWTAWAALAPTCDAAWPIAPETDGALEDLTRLIASSGKAVIGPDAETVRLAASKAQTAARLAARGVAVVPVHADGLPEAADGPFVTKPDDGAGCCETRFWPGRPPAEAVGPGIVVQPYVEGVPASLVMACRDGAAVLLAASRQDVVVEGSTFRFRGVAVGGLPEDASLHRLIEAIAEAMPGLRGLIGVDFIVTDRGPVVLEVNPRLTTSYVGLRRALGDNPLRWVAELDKEDEAMPARRAVRPVTIEV